MKIRTIITLLFNRALERDSAPCDPILLDLSSNLMRLYVKYR